MGRAELGRGPTGSIQNCESQSYDEFGNCLLTPDPDMHRVDTQPWKSQASLRRLGRGDDLII
jgi:hypothetical protein